ncbi:MAG TPA: alpha/beta hydrolase [Chloroflexota bacterium]|jgi:pimeloyl-ACP methyl ester carboxylesterase
MTVQSARFTTEQVPVGETQLYLLQGGTGRPCLVLHGLEGHEGWLAFHEALAQSATVYAPSHPGYGHTNCPPWITSIQHQAVFYNWFLDAARLSQVDLVGIGVGGWIAAHMAVLCSTALRSLTLVGAAGVKPIRDEIFDVFVNRWPAVLARGFSDPEHSAEYRRLYGETPIAEFGGLREAGRVMSMKMCFRPYMYDPALPAMLAKVRVPTLIVWGDDDRIMPLECATLYQQAIPESTVKVIDNCGHFVHLDRPHELAACIREFNA